MQWLQTGQNLFSKLSFKKCCKKIKSVCPPKKAYGFQNYNRCVSIYAPFFSLPPWYQKKHELKVDTKMIKSQNLLLFDIQGAITRDVLYIANKFKHKLCINTFLFDRKPLEFITFHTILR